MTTGELLLDELEKAAEDLMKYGEHDGACTNAHQMSLMPKIAPCTKHHSSMKTREDRFRRALEQVKLLRDMFGAGQGF